MLSEIRERATGWIAYIIVGIIIIPFAFWGVNQYFAGGEDVIVATVDGVEIDQTQYRQALESRRGQMRQLLGENFNPELANSTEFKRGVIDDLVSQVLLTHHADDQGYRVGDQQLAETIRSNPRFREGEAFSQDAYRSVVAQMGLTETGFESRLRQQLILQQIREGIRGSSIVPPGEEQRLLRLMTQQRQFDYAVMETGNYLDDATVTDAEIEEEYQAASERYRTPEQLKIEYVELSVDDLASNVDVSDEEIQRAYEQNRDRFTTDPVRRASHILIEVAPDAGEVAQQEALGQARDILDQLRSGAEFAALAKKHSDDPGSAEQGGDLGRVEPGSMVEPFEDALFALEEQGALTEPVKTRFGYHVIKLTEYQPPVAKPLEEVRDELAQEERARQAEAMFLDRAETFRNVSYEQPQSLEPVADQLDLTIQQSDWFTRNEGTGIASSPKVREAAFGEDVYAEGLNSGAIELNINTLVVVRRLDTKPASLKPLEDVRDDIEARLKRRKARERVADLGPGLVSALETGTNWQALVDEHGLEVKQATLSRADAGGQTQADPALVDAVFRAPPPSEQPVYGGLSLANGNFALFRLVEIMPGDPGQAPESLVQRVRSALDQRQSQDMLDQYIADLREQAEVTVKEGQL